MSAEGFRFAEDPLAAPSSPRPRRPGGSVRRRSAATWSRPTGRRPSRCPRWTTSRWSIPRARVTVVVGPSGSGKSSLLRLLACIDRPDAGQVRVAGRRVDTLRARARRRVRRRQVAYLFQRPGENLLPYLDAVAQVRLAASLRGAQVTDDEVLDPAGPARPRRPRRPPPGPALRRRAAAAGGRLRRRRRPRAGGRRRAHRGARHRGRRAGAGRDGGAGRLRRRLRRLHPRPPRDGDRRRVRPARPRPGGGGVQRPGSPGPSCGSVLPRRGAGARAGRGRSHRDRRRAGRPGRPLGLGQEHAARAAVRLGDRRRGHAGLPRPAGRPPPGHPRLAGPRARAAGARAGHRPRLADNVLLPARLRGGSPTSRSAPTAARRLRPRAPGRPLPAPGLAGRAAAGRGGPGAAAAPGGAARRRAHRPPGPRARRPAPRRARRGCPGGRRRAGRDARRDRLGPRDRVLSMRDGYLAEGRPS